MNDIHYTVVVKTGPVAEPVTLVEASDHLRVEAEGSPLEHDDDTRIEGIIKAAREWIEEEYSLAIIEQTLEQKMDAFPGGSKPIRLRRAPVISVDSIVYTDSNGDEQPWSDAKYDYDADSKPTRIKPAYGENYPATRDVMNAVVIEFTGGYGTEPVGVSPSEVPEPVRQAILLLLGHWYENREALMVGTISKAIEFGVRSLLGTKRWTL